MSNRLGIDDEKYWQDTKIKGFGFGEDKDSNIEEDNIFYGISQERSDAATITKVNQELRAEVSSLSSFISDGSSEETHESMQRLRDLPPFLWNDSGPLELELDRPVSGALSPEIFMLREQDAMARPLHLPSVDETIHQFLNSSEHILLEHYQSLSQKKQLLTKAIEINDGNAILGVTLFLYKSLKHSIFRHILIENKAAANHYIRYLETKNEVNHLVDLLNMLGRTKESMLIRYKQILRREGNLVNFLKEMEHFHQAECQLSNEEVVFFFNQHLQLLHIQKEIKEKKDSSFIHSDHPSVLKTLNYVAEHFYENPNPPLTVDNIKQKFNLNVKQFNWVVLKALVKTQSWPKVEILLLTKTWLGSSKDKCLLPLEDVCNTLKDAPTDLISRFVRLIDDVEKKLNTARRLKCHMVVIDVYAAQKDRAAILTYKSNLEENCKESVYAESVLKHTAIKWKN